MALRLPAALQLSTSPPRRAPRGAACASCAAAPAASRRSAFVAGAAVAVAPRARAADQTLVPTASAKRAVSAAASGQVRVDIQGRHLELTPALKEHALNKIGHVLSQFDVGAKEAMVRLSARSRERQPGEPLQKAEVTLTTRRGVVRGECTDATLYAAIDRVADVVARQLRRMKELEQRGGQAGHHHSRSASTISDLLPEQPIDIATERTADLPQDVIRKKVFHVEALSVNDAVDRMEAIGHAFYLFRALEGPDAGEVQVVYRRNAGGYGVLVPKA